MIPIFFLLSSVSRLMFSMSRPMELMEKANTPQAKYIVILEVKTSRGF